MRVDFARLNHVLIPKTKTDRDRFRKTTFGRIVIPIFGFWGSLTDEGRTLFVVAPLAGAISIDVQRTSAYIVVSLLFGLLVGSILAARLLVLRHATVLVHAPRRVTVGDEIVFRVVCRRDAQGARDAQDARDARPACTSKKGLRGRLDHESDDAAVPIRIRGPFLPWDGTWMATAPVELDVAAGESAETTMRARFVARGLHHLESFTAAIVLPLGLACGPRTASDGVKIWVVPRVAEIASLALPIASKHQPGGVALASKAGESMDLLGVRPYRPGDPVRDLHARTWARTGTPAVREYQQEYFTRVGVVLDTSMRDPDRLEAAIALAGGVIAHLSRGEALIDVLVVGDTVHELTLGRSLGRLDQALELLAGVERGPILDAQKLVTRLEPHLARLSSIVAIVAEPDGASRAERDRAADERKRLEHKLREHGLACRMVVVDGEKTRAVEAKEALVL